MRQPDRRIDNQIVSVNILGSRRLLAVLATASLWTLWTRPLLYGQTAEAERVIVTGSNIPTAEEVGPNPVTTLNRDYIQKTGNVNVEQLLKDQPVNNSNSIPVANNGTGQGGPTGFSSVALRALDPSASLVLVDGRRVTQVLGFAFVDINTIPLA